MKTNSQGFVMVLTMVLAVIVSIVWFSALNSITKINQYIESEKTENEFLEKAKDAVYMQLKYDDSLNKDGLGSDTTFCSGWLIVHNESSTSCNGIVQVGTDGVDDVCNNDDRTPYFYDRNISINNFVDSTSILYDNDADARIYNIWVVFPWEEKTIFYYDATVRDSLLLNTNNTYFSLPSSGKKSRIKFEFMWWWTGTGELKIITVNKNLGVNQTVKWIIAWEDDGLLNENADLSLAKPFLLDVYNEDYVYAVNIYNPTSKIWYYSSELLDMSGEKFYQVPIEYFSRNKWLMYNQYNKYWSFKQIKIYQ